MSNYKKAAELKLRFQTSKGLLSVEQVMDLKMETLKTLIKEQYKLIKESDSSESDLAFLENDSKEKDNIEVLRFEILKDIYETKKQEKISRQDAAKLREELAEIDAEIAEREKAERKEISKEDLLKRREEILKGLK